MYPLAANVLIRTAVARAAFALLASLLVACGDRAGGRAGVDSAGAATAARADTLALARLLAVTLAFAPDSGSEPARQALLAPGGRRADAPLTTWDSAVLSELRALSPDYFAPAAAREATAWLALGQLEFPADTAMAGVHWRVCAPGGFFESVWVKHRFVREAGTWHAQPATVTARGHGLCAPAPPASDSARAQSGAPAA